MEQHIQFMFNDKEKDICFITQLRKRYLLTGQDATVICDWSDFQVVFSMAPITTKKKFFLGGGELGY